MMGKKAVHAPLVEALIRYRSQGNASFHVPGHKNGQVYRHEELAALLQEVMSIDATEITGLDDLHHPEDVIREGQELAAKCFGAEESFWLIGGSTVGNLAMILTVCTEPGDVLLVQRNVHKSVLNGLMLSGAKAVFLEPEIDTLSGLAVAPSTDTIKAALKAYPLAKGVLLTLPNYYGMGHDLTATAKACHAAHVPLMVDEAHGAHYGLHPHLPVSALSCGADVVVQSTHKMLSAMTMGAMLHVQGPRIHRELLRQRLAMVQSSSPSYPLMASLDLARWYIDAYGTDAFTEGLAAADAFRKGLEQLPRFRLLEPTQQANEECKARKGISEALDSAKKRRSGYSTQDPFKMVLYDTWGVLDGFGLKRELETYGCIPEMSDEKHVVLLFTLSSTARDASHLLQALVHINNDIGFKGTAREPELAGKEQQRLELDFSTWNNDEMKAYSSPVQFGLQPIHPDQMEIVPVEESAGRIAAEMIIPYPPGIPLLYAGETVTQAIALRMNRLRELGAKWQGVADESMLTIRVFRLQ
ncbi:aminotransferase class I/II-fold pyridoxal phosphate-dependent enzyme [Paenibacillus ottowii]|uniref:Aminotransferase class I/II-fold pyridoxal phosphate-dependent enzyme n=1 Tax=Paenibacillus ottowii TaxID=2315729 RepID=A0ABY3AY45_9BACL|nr:aminotransferase class I/II-fold pyridoxal phosphate-dependent enzyme [Paenibacillus ottowii]TQR94442.1 aminotransferase class I/II-fold pyridoxal phosphate-dependent enzyme [Paenibacillus ottowii]